MAEKVVSVRLQAHVEGFTAGMRKAKKSVDDLTKADVPKAAKGYKDLADKAALAGAAIAVGLGVAVKRFADFDKAMSGVAANSGAAGAELEALRQSAIKLGADSQFTATEAAQGINELAKAGVATADVLGGGLKGALDLAAAGQIGVAQAAETTASAMTQFKLGGDEAVHVADLLASGANKAQGGVGDLGAALGQAGLVAAATGLSIEETTAGLTAFASAGLIGSDAGTSFKTMLQRLSAPMGPAAEEMTKLGISAYDAQGNFVGLANVAEQLKQGMEDLTPAQRNAAMSVIFGQDAVRASTILYNEGAAGINKWITAVDDQGAAAKQAAALTDNLAGDIERLGGAFDTALIQTGSGANASLRTLVQGLEGLVGVIANVPGPLLLAGGGLTALALTAPKAISSFREMAATMDSVGLSFEKVAARGPRAAKGVDLTRNAVKGLGVVAAAVVAAGVLDKIFGPDGGRPGQEGLTRDLLGADDAVTAFSARMKTFADESSNWWSSNQVTNFGDAIHDVFNPSTAQQIDNAAGSLLGMVGAQNNADIANATAALKDLDGVLSGLVSGGNADEAKRQFDQFAAAAALQGVPVEQLMTKLPGYADLLAGAGNAAELAAGPTGDLAGATEDATTAADKATTALDKLKTAIEGLGSPQAQARAAERDFQASIDDASKSIADQRDELIKTRTEEVSSGKPSKAATDAVAKAKQNLAQAQEKLNALDKDATKSQKLTAQQRVEKATLALTQAQGRLNDSTGKAKELTDADREAIEKWADAQLRGKDLLDVNTEAGRTNQAALDAIRTTTLANVAATYENTGSTELATAAMQRGRDAFIVAAIAAGKTKEEAGLLADQLELIPGNVAIAVSASGIVETESAINLVARDRTAVIKVTPVAGGSWDVFHPKGNPAAPSSWDIFHPGKTATGGAIRGPGTGTSDTAGLWALSNNEHVWTAAEVAKLGGHSAMYALRAAVRQGRFPGLAGGGAVTPQYAPRVQYVQVAGSGQSSGMRITKNMHDYGGVTVLASDPAELAQQLADLQRQRNIAGGL